jgi:mannitol-1-phosphate 5-dehydrogenase
MYAVHFGAGNIGRGFIGQLLHQSGYEVCFVDVNDEIVEEINKRKEYTVTLASVEQTAFRITDVSAIEGQQEDKVVQAIANADIVTTAVGPNVLKFIAPVIAKGIVFRFSLNNKPLNIIACENMIGGSTSLKSHVFEHLTDAERETTSERIGFPDAAVDRIVPIQKHEDKLLVTVEPFYEWVVNQSQVLGEVPAIQGITYVDDLKPYIERKLFTVNTGHATVAYLGYIFQIESIDKAMKNTYIVDLTRKVLSETGALLVAKYQFNKEQHEEYINKILKRFNNPHISDEVVRVGRSPKRKLSAQDRLVGPALQAYEMGIVPSGLATAIAAALLFDYNEDSEAVEIQYSIQENGFEGTIYKYTGLPKDHPLLALIREQYDYLKSQRVEVV